MLSGAGANIEQGITIIVKNKDKLYEMANVFESNQISAHLNRYTVGQMQAEIDRLYKAFTENKPLNLEQPNPYTGDRAALEAPKQKPPQERNR
jgi:hypothetical protein